MGHQTEYIHVSHNHVCISFIFVCMHISECVYCPHIFICLSSAHKMCVCVSIYMSQWEVALGRFYPDRYNTFLYKLREKKTLLCMLLMNSHIGSNEGGSFPLRIFKGTKPPGLLILHGEGQNTVWPADQPLTLVSRWWPVPSVTLSFHGPLKSTRRQICKTDEWSEVAVIYSWWITTIINGVTCGTLMQHMERERSRSRLVCKSIHL